MADQGHPPPEDPHKETCHRNLQQRIYQYLINKNLHDAAETFRIEAQIELPLFLSRDVARQARSKRQQALNLKKSTHPTSSSGSSSSAKVPREGTLIKLWKTSYRNIDSFREIMHLSDTREKDPSTMGKGKQKLEGTQCNPGQNSTNAQEDRQLLDRLASEIKTWSELQHSMAPRGSDQVPQEVSPSSNPEGLQTSTPRTSSVNIPHTSDQQELDPDLMHMTETFWSEFEESVDKLWDKSDEDKSNQDEAPQPEIIEISSDSSND